MFCIRKKFNKINFLLLRIKIRYYCQNSKSSNWKEPNPEFYLGLYSGTTLNGEAHGIGRVIFKDGDISEGQFKHGQQYGFNR